MTLRPRAFQKSGKLLLLVLFFIEVFLVLIYLAGILRTGKAYPLFDMDGLRTLPSILQAFQLFVIGFIALSLLLVGRHSSNHPSRLFLLTVAILFTYASLDELFKIHLQLKELLSISNSRGWMAIYLGIGVSTLVGFHRDFIALWRFHPRSTLAVGIGMGIFVLGGLGSEILKYTLLQPLLYHAFQQGDYMILFLEKLRVALEEFSELLGQNITIYGLGLYVTKRFAKER